MPKIVSKGVLRELLCSLALLPCPSLPAPHRLALPRRPLELSLAPASCCSLELPSPFRQACSFPGSPRWWGTVRSKGKGKREKSVLMLVLSAHSVQPSAEIRWFWFTSPS
ncbi:hypothetical protein FPQ18DRAFT_324355, partial [Pyronema domesticum]